MQHEYHYNNIVNKIYCIPVKTDGILQERKEKMGKDILRHVIRFAVRLVIAGIIFLAGVLLNGAVFNSNYGGGLPIIMLAFGVIAAVVVLIAAFKFVKDIVGTVRKN